MEVFLENIMEAFREVLEAEGLNLFEVLGVIVAGGVITALIANKKGRNTLLWGIYGLIFTIFAIIHALLMSPIEGKIWRKCPFCAEMVKREAKVCKHCGKDL